MRASRMACVVMMTVACCLASAAASGAAAPNVPIDTFTYNLPCQVVNIHAEQPGKALLFVWLHGGVHDQKIHSFFTHPNHWDNCAADDSVIHYLSRHGIKAIALMPMCHRADRNNCLKWHECYDDVKVMIDDYVNKGLVDPQRIYLAGSSDGGRGTWDFVAEHPDVWAAAISMSCSEPRMTSVPTYFYNTADERECTNSVAMLREQGANILVYEYCGGFKHGGDAARCTDELLTDFFSHVKEKTE